MEKLLTLAEVGAVLRLSHHTLRRWAKAGVLPVVRFGRRRVRVRPVDLERLMRTGLTLGREAKR
jgi:excisionase family DNA binding protein